MRGKAIWPLFPRAERDDLVAAYYKRLTSPDAQIRQSAARAWSIWEASTSKLIPDTDLIERFGSDRFADAFARIECHYFINGGFFTEDRSAAQKHRPHPSNSSRHCARAI